jgi:hypothetical protein
MDKSQLKHRADAIAWIHLVWILFGIISLPLVFIVPSWDKFSLIFIAITVLSWIVFRGCLFLDLENKLRREYNPAEAYDGQAFIQYYLKKIFNIHCSRFWVRTFIYTYLVILAIVSLVH